MVERRQLGQTDLRVPQLGLGTWGLCDGAYGPVGDAQVKRTLTRALDTGVTLFDMAPSWGPEGRAESAVAEVVAERREEAFYVSRAGMGHADVGLEPDFSSAGLIASCEASLKRLRTDRLDVLLLHNPDADVMAREHVAKACEQLVKQGKARAWGASVASTVSARAALAAGAQVLCLPHNLVRPRLLWSIESEIENHGAGVLISAPLAHGLLAGRWSAHKGFASTDHRSRRWSREALAARVAEVQSLRKLVRDDVLSLSSAALRFCLSEPLVSAVLVGARTPGQVESAARALGEPPYLPADARAELRRKAGY